MNASHPFERELCEIVGPEWVSRQSADLNAYSRDLWPRSQLDRLAGDPPARPAFVVWPKDADQVVQLVRACVAAGRPLVPFGGGSGVCGGTKPGPEAVLVDLKRLDGLRKVDHEALTVEVEAGLIGERLERRLNALGLTLGHFPSSIGCSTVGGWVASRSAGQSSGRYGKIEDMVLSLEVVTGEGTLVQTGRSDALQAGPALNGLFLGSEGTLGVVTAALLKVWPAPAVTKGRGLLMPSVEAGLATMRDALQAGLKPAVLRLYDPLDTLLGSHSGVGEGSDKLKKLLTGGTAGLALKDRAIWAALASPRLLNAGQLLLPRAALLIAVCEGEADDADETDLALARIAVRHGAQDLGPEPALHWLAHRLDVSFKQSAIYQAGAFVDTFEVATTWAKLPTLYRNVRQALSPFALVMAHFSHAYEGGCSIYFTFAGTAVDVRAMRRRYDQAWRAGLDAAITTGATIAHHHGAGLSRARHMAAAHGEARRWFEAAKGALDPARLFNPGKLFQEDDR